MLVPRLIFIRIEPDDHSPDPFADTTQAHVAEVVHNIGIEAQIFTPTIETFPNCRGITINHIAIGGKLRIHDKCVGQVVVSASR